MAPGPATRRCGLIALRASTDGVPLGFYGRDYAAAISRVALIGSFSTLQRAVKFAFRGQTRSSFPYVNARRADADLFGNFNNR